MQDLGRGLCWLGLSVYLQLHQCETATGSNAAVVFDCRTSDDRSELIYWARSDRCGL